MIPAAIQPLILFLSSSLMRDPVSISRLVGDQVRGSSSSRSIGNPDDGCIGSCCEKVAAGSLHERNNQLRKKKEAEERQLLLFVSLSPSCLLLCVCVSGRGAIEACGDLQYEFCSRST